MQDSLRQKAERIEELEEALRESVQINAEREMVLAQEEAARSLQEKQVHLRLTPAQPPSYTRFLRLWFILTTGMSPILSHSPCLFVLNFDLSVLIVFSFLSATLRSTHSNQCMSPTTPT